MAQVGCIFCRIVAGEVPAQIVWRSGAVLAFLDIGPLAEGHLLVIPRKHAARLVELEEGEAAALVGAIPRLGRSLLQVTGAAAFNVLINNGPEAGQVVEHVHAHLIPRRQGDGLGYRWNAGKYAEGRMQQLGEQYRKVLEAR